MEEEDTGQNELEPTGYEGHGGALVEEAKRLIKYEEEDENALVRVNQVKRLKCQELEVKIKKQLQGQQLLKNLP